VIEGKMSASSTRFCFSIFLITLLTIPAVGQTKYGKFGVGIDFSMVQILGAGSVNSSPGFGGGINMSVSVIEGIGIRSKFSINQINWETEDKSVKTDFMSLNLYFSGDLMPNSNLNIFPFIGIGFVFYDPKDEISGGRPAYESSFDTHFSSGIGLDYFPNEFWSVTLMPEYIISGSRYYNGPADPGKDSFLRINVQARYYFFNQS
jgi:hypothetical protein